MSCECLENYRIIRVWGHPRDPITEIVDTIICDIEDSFLISCGHYVIKFIEPG